MRHGILLFLLIFTFRSVYADSSNPYREEKKKTANPILVSNDKSEPQHSSKSMKRKPKVVKPPGNTSSADAVEQSKIDMEINRYFILYGPLIHTFGNIFMPDRSTNAELTQFVTKILNLYYHYGIYLKIAFILYLSVLFGFWLIGFKLFGFTPRSIMLPVSIYETIRQLGLNHWWLLGAFIPLANHYLFWHVMKRLLNGWRLPKFIYIPIQCLPILSFILFPMRLASLKTR